MYRQVRPVSAGITRNWPVFKLIRNVGISILVYIPVRYILTSTIGIGMASTTLYEMPKYGGNIVLSSFLI